jgi:glutaredoxin
MIDTIEFVHEDGRNKPCDIAVYALSTCGFCKRSLAFLRENSIAFRYVYVDLLDAAMKDTVKSALSDTFKTRIGFPFAVLNGNEYLRGFVQDEWEKRLLQG